MGFINDFVEGIAFEMANLIVTLFAELAHKVFYLEENLESLIIGDILPTGGVDKLYTFMSGVAVSLIILKVLKKGFFTYILWRDGDPDASIQGLVIGTVTAVAMAILFPTFYGWYADVSIWLTTRISAYTIDITEGNPWVNVAAGITPLGFAYIIVIIIYFIMLLVLYLHFLKRSAELFALRMGFPLACTGLTDSDNGAFATTTKLFIQVSLTTIMQLFFMQLSTMIMIKSAGEFCFVAIACVMAAFSTPRMMQNIVMAVGGGGGVGQKVASSFYMANAVRGILGR